MIYSLPNIKIESISACLPATKINLKKRKISSEKKQKIINTTGINFIYKSDKAQTSADLCYRAALPVLKDVRFPTAIVYVTTTPDYLSNSTSIILQDRFKFPVDTVCMDLNFGCSGYVFGLFQAAMLLNSSKDLKSVLLLVGETTTKSLNPDDFATSFIFSDAGSASVITRSSGRILFQLASDGSGSEALIKKAGGYRVLAKNSSPFLKMNGEEIMNFIATGYINSLLEFKKLSFIRKKTLKRYFFHQASKLINNYICAKLKLSTRVAPETYSIFGNSGNASIPLTICTNLPLLQKNKSELESILSGFGVGLSWGHTTLNLKGTYNYGVTFDEKK